MSAEDGSPGLCSVCRTLCISIPSLCCPRPFNALNTLIQAHVACWRASLTDWSASVTSADRHLRRAACCCNDCRLFVAVKLAHAGASAVAYTQLPSEAGWLVVRARTSVVKVT